MGRLEWRKLGVWMARTAGMAALAALALMPAAAAAQVVAGQEIMLSSSGDHPSVASRGGATAVVWDEGAIHGLLLLPGQSGRPLAPLGGLIAGLPQVAMAADGQFVVAWQAGDTADSTGIFLQRLRANGALRGTPVRANSVVARNQTNPRLAMAPGGSYVVGWEDVEANGEDSLRAVFFDARGRRQGRPVRMSDQGDSSLIGGVGADDSGFAAAWTEVTECGTHPGSEVDLVSAVARFDAQGRTMGPVERFGDDALCAGGPVAAGVPGSDFGPLGVFDGNTVSVQRFSPDDGEPVGERINVYQAPECTAAVCERVAAVAGDRRGRVLVVWERRETVAGQQLYDLFAQLYGREGRARSPRFQVNNGSSLAEQHPAAALAADGHAYVAWRRGGNDAEDGLLLRPFLLDGEVVTP